MGEVYQLTEPFKAKSLHGKRCKRGPMPEETKAKIRYKRQFQSTKGRKFSLQARENISLAHMGVVNDYDRSAVLTIEVRKKISDGVKRYWANKKLNQ